LEAGSGRGYSPPKKYDECDRCGRAAHFSLDGLIEGWQLTSETGCDHGRKQEVAYDGNGRVVLSTKMENRQATDFCKELVVGVATTLLTELTNPKKSTHNYINDGLLAFDNLSVAEKEASLGMRANNDPSEGIFATFTDVLCNSGRISIDSAAGIGQARYNKDLDCKHGCFVTRGKGKY
jgi:hypothetical protein